MRTMPNWPMPKWTMLLVAVAGCDDALVGSGDACGPAFVLDEFGRCVFDEPSVAELMQRFDQGELERVNDAPFEQITDEGVARNVWITPEVVGLYQLVDPDRTDEVLPREFPVGTVIVHERMDRSEGSTVQIKREPEWVGDDGALWWMGKYREDGTPDEVPCSPCVHCHSAAMHPTTDGLWGVPREAIAQGAG